MHDQRHFRHAATSPLPPPALFMTDREPAAAVPRDHGDREPLFLDEPADHPPSRSENLLEISDLFLDEGDPAVWDAERPALSPERDAGGDLRLTPPALTQARTRVNALRRSTIATAMVVFALLAVAGASIYRARGGSVLALWHSLGF